MTLHQTFRNDEDHHIEAIYTFPLPWGAVLVGLEVTLGEKRMVGEVMARSRAASTYEDAIEQGDAPVMVEKNLDGSFTASLGSLRPGEQATVELSYAQLLNFEQGRVRLVVPTTIAPRYGDAVADAGLLPPQASHPDLLAEHAFALDLTIAGPLSHARISCPSHIVTQQAMQGEARIGISGDAWLDRDFVLLMEGLEGQCLAVAGPDPAAGEEHHALIASFCPQRSHRPAASLALKILVDCSGSMGGDSISQARAALRALAAALKDGDRFTYSRFGSAPHLVLPARQSSALGLQQLTAAIDQTDANLGGTEMGVAFDHVFDLALADVRGEAEADVLVITDGAVWGVQSLLARARQSGHRIHALGVGSAPAESLLSELAQASGGSCEFATPNESMVAAMGRLLTRMRSASAVEMNLEVQPQPSWCSPLPRRVADDETVHVLLRLPGRPDTPPHLRFNGQDIAPPDITWLQDDLVARIVAARQISHTASEAEAAELANRYQLVTDHTNLLLVFQRAESDKTDGMPALRAVRPMLAAGAGGVGSVRPARDGLMAGGASPHSRMSAARMQSTPHVLERALHQAARYSLVGSSLEPQESRVYPDDLQVLECRLDPDDLLEGREAAFHIVRRFNEAVQPGLSFREVLRSVMVQPMDSMIPNAVAFAAESAGSLIKGWAWFLMWVHQLNAPEAQLSDAALALVQGQLATGDIERHPAVTKIFERAIA
jgi:Ca-activated chloride channel family protein